MTVEIIAQIIGLVASALTIISFQCRSNRRLFLFQALSWLFFATHFLLLGAYSGFTQSLLSLVRMVILIYGSEKLLKSHLCLAALLAAFLISGHFSYIDPFSFLPVIAMLCLTVAMWTRDGKKIRIAQLFLSSPFWLVYDIHVMSVSGIIASVFSIVSVIVSFARHGKKGFTDKP